MFKWSCIIFESAVLHHVSQYLTVDVFSLLSYNDKHTKHSEDSFTPSLRYQMGDSGARSHINMKPDHMFLALLVCRDDTSRGKG